MSRIIKYRQPIFRGGVFTGWHYWGYLTGSLDAFTTPMTSNDGTILESHMFIGALDGNKNEIYEGDVVKVTSTEEYYHDANGSECDDDCKPKCPYEPHSENTVVKWNPDHGGFTWDEADLFEGEYTMPFSDLASDYVFEVIGNIIENPELA